MNYKVCSSCAKHVRDTEPRCWNCSAAFSDPTSPLNGVEKTLKARTEVASFVGLGNASSDDTAVSKAETASTKRCPFCAEDIQKDAIRCKHCKSDLTSSPRPTTRLPFVPIAGAAPTSGVLFFLMAFVLFILSLVLGPFGPLLLVFCTAIWAGVDASTHKLAEYQNGLGGPAGAFFGSLLFWILVFPWYLAIRSRIRAGVQPVRA
jgi:hypothetical protein